MSTIKRVNRDGAAQVIVPAVHFQAITWYDQENKRQIIMLYALGEDGIVRELNGGKWHPYPILKSS